MNKLGTYLLYGGTLVLAITLICLSVSPNEKTPLTDIGASIKGSASQPINKQSAKPAEKIQVYLFHATNRCYSCVTAGQLAQKTIDQKFSEELKSGKIEFKEINIDLPENKEVAAKFKATGTSFFINPIINGQDNIKEDTQVWRLVSNEQTFITYFSDKLKGMLGNEASARVEESKKETAIIFFYGEDCPHCATAEKYFEENKIKEKVNFEEKEIYNNRDNAKLLAEKAKDCEMDDLEIGVPFLWASGRCYMGDEDIIDFFSSKL